MIVDVRKFLIYGAKEEMDRFFALAQRAGFIEFIGIWHKKSLQLSPEIKNILMAIKILRRWVGLEEEVSLAIPSDVGILAERVIHLNSAIEHLLEEERVLQADITRIAPFGEFSMNDLNAFEREGKRIVQFFCMKSNLARDLELPSEMIHVGTDYDLDYFIAINKEKVHYPRMIEIHVDKPAAELKAYLQDVHSKISAFESELKSCAASLPMLQQGLAENLNEYDLKLAKHDASFPIGEAFFAIEAWVPESKIETFREMLKGLSISSEEISIESSDRIPTYLENSGSARIGEDLISYYDTPAITDQDPSGWVTFFFAMFFAIIVSDAGYGLIFLILWGVLKWKFPRLAEEQKRMLKLLYLLAAASIVWGVLTAGYFGIRVDPSHPLRKMSVLDRISEKKAAYHMAEQDGIYQAIKQKIPAVSEAKDGREFLMKAVVDDHGRKIYVALDEFNDSLLMEGSILIGMMHISLAFLWHLRKKWSGLGWVSAIFGGYLFFPSMLGTASLAVVLGWLSAEMAAQIGFYMIFGGLGFALVASWIQKGIVAALREPLQAIEVFNDVLSYLRLYALGLAGMMIAETVNSMAADVGLIAGILIILFGHSVNLTLAVMGGIIHGLRLNFLEWFRHCFEGGGKPFNPLRLRKTKL